RPHPLPVHGRLRRTSPRGTDDGIMTQVRRAGINLGSGAALACGARPLLHDIIHSTGPNWYLTRISSRNTLLTDTTLTFPSRMGQPKSATLWPGDGITGE